MPGEQARDEIGRWTVGNGPRSPVGPHAHTRSVGTHPPADGTADAYGVAPRDGYMVGGAAHSRYTGTWRDPASGEVYVEKSTHVSGAAQAVALGRARNQISIFDIARQRTIGTGGNGKPQ
jgi:hypothetical protein